jgi:hypothetical protein
MTMQITLPKQLEERLHQEAKRRGERDEAVVLGVLDLHLPMALDARQAAAVALLRGWAVEDASLTAEELSANAAVLQSLDEDRPSYRKLFDDIRDGQ